MNSSYVTGGMIRSLRERCGMTQAALSEALYVSDKTVSKWETGKGYPDITLIEPLAAALGVSVAELLSGTAVTNRNRGGNMRRAVLYVCPVCGNVISAVGEAAVSCCGILLPPAEAEEPDDGHRLTAERVEDDYYLHIDHEMTKEHYISFFAAVTDSGRQFVKLYPEGDAAARFPVRGVRELQFYCNRHGLFRVRPPRPNHIHKPATAEGPLV